jgi:hypothetical protein
LRTCALAHTHFSGQDFRPRFQAKISGQDFNVVQFGRFKIQLF